MYVRIVSFDRKPNIPDSWSKILKYQKLLCDMITISELIGALCTILAFISAAQIILTGILSFAFPHFLSLSHCNVATAAGVVSGLVAVPMIVQLRTAQISPLIELRYGYTKWYQITAILICTSLHVVADIIALTSAVIPRQWDQEFLNKMKEYKVRKSSKSLVDNIQWALQCCGSLSYKDWHAVEWTKISARSTLVDIIRDTSGYSELTKEVNAVPFSCCARKILDTCMHYNVVQYGTNTINVAGCSSKVKSTAQLIIWSEFSVYATCVLIEGIILFCLIRAPDRSMEGENDLQFSKCLHKAKMWAESRHRIRATPLLEQRKK